MPQLFPPGSNSLARAMLIGGAGALPAFVWGAYAVYWSPLNTGVGTPVEQPVPFSHQHHAGELGIDCRYCHTTVETSAFAGIPPTETCMTCHSQIWRDAPVLEPVRASWAGHRPLRWARVNDLPDYVYFDHSIHIAKGIGCVSCHGRVDAMPLMAKGQSLTMRWCLDCHRDPGRQMRPASAVFTMRDVPPADRAHADEALRARHVEAARLEDCSICHR